MSADAMPVKMSSHVQTACHRLHVPFEHGTDAMTARMKQTRDEFCPFLLEPFDRFECLARELLLCQGQEPGEMVVIVAGRLSMIDPPDAGLQLWINRMVFTAVADA